LATGPDDPVAITGPNGVGKGARMRQILAEVDLADERRLHVPRRLDASQSRKIVTAAWALTAS
jgi:ABC-type transport system involved in cytochrome c biogenesis ATPase subunit